MNPSEYLQAAKYALSQGEAVRFQSLCQSIINEYPDSPEAAVARQLLSETVGTDSQVTGSEGPAELAEARELVVIRRVFSAVLIVHLVVFSRHLVWAYALLSWATERRASLGASTTVEVVWAVCVFALFGLLLVTLWMFTANNWGYLISASIFCLGGFGAVALISSTFDLSVSSLMGPLWLAVIDLGLPILVVGLYALVADEESDGYEDQGPITD